MRLISTPSVEASNLERSDWIGRSGVGPSWFTAGNNGDGGGRLGRGWWRRFGAPPSVGTADTGAARHDYPNSVLDGASGCSGWLPRSAMALPRRTAPAVPCAQYGSWEW
jgi:hypothetical protein